MTKKFRKKKLEKEMSVRAIVIGFFVCSCVFVASVSDVTATEGPEDINNVSVQELLVKQQQKPHEPLDPFAIAFFGLSVGGMLLTSAIHTTRSRMKQMQSDIKKLDAFISTTTCVTFTTVCSNEEDPMQQRIKDISDASDGRIGALEKERDKTLAAMSNVETELLHIWG